MRIAKDTHQRVLAYNDDATITNTAGEIPSSMKSARVGYFDENGNWQTEDRTVAVNGDRNANTADRAAANTASNANEHGASTTAPAAAANTANDRAAANTAQSTTARNNTARSTTARNNTADRNGQPTGTSGQATRRHLPRTASNMALFELLSGLALGAGLLTRTLRARLAEAR
jgi:hypothetical protein